MARADEFEEGPIFPPIAPPVDADTAWSAPPPVYSPSPTMRDSHDRVPLPPVDADTAWPAPAPVAPTPPPAAAPWQDPMPQGAWKGVEDFLGRMGEGANQWVQDRPLLDAFVGPYRRSSRGEATPEDIMEIGLDRSTSGLGGVGIGAGLAAGAVRRVGKYVAKGLDVFDNVGNKIYGPADNSAQAKRFADNMNKGAFTDTSDEAARANEALRETTQTRADQMAERTAKAVGGEQTKMDFSGVPAGRLTEFEVPPQSGRRFAPETPADQTTLFDTPSQAPLPEGSGPSGLPFSFTAADEAERAAREGASEAATFTSRGGVLDPGSVAPPARGQLFPPERVPGPDVPPVIGEGGAVDAEQGLFPGPIFEQAPTGGPRGLPYSLSREDEITRAIIDNASAEATFKSRGGITGMVSLPPTGAPPIIPGGLSSALKSIEEMESAAAALLSKDPRYANQLMLAANDMRVAHARATSIIEEAIAGGAPVKRDAVHNFYDLIQAAATGANKKISNVFDPDTNVGHIFQVTGNVAGQIIPSMRASMATFDISLSLRQGLIPAIAHNPGWRAAQAAGLKALGTEEGYKAAERGWQSLDSYALGKNAGVAEMSIDPTDSAANELFQSQFVEKIWGFGKGVKMSTRHAAAFSNTARFSIFDTYSKAWGIPAMQATDPAKAKRMAEDLASFVNSITGIGDLGAAKSAAGVLSQGFFSPKFFASRLNNLFAPFVYTVQAMLPEGAPLAQRVAYGAAAGAVPGAVAGALKDEDNRMVGALKGAAGGALLGGGLGGTAIKGGGSWQMAGLAWRDMSAYYATMGLIASLAAAAGAEVGTDPESSNFMKISIDDHHIDMTGGYASLTRTMFQLTTGEKKTQKGKSVKLREAGVAEEDAGAAIWKYGRGLLAPAPSSAIDILSGNRDIGGNPQGITGHIPLPIGIGDAWDAIRTDYENNPETLGLRGAGLALLGATGVGVQTYKKGEKKPAVSENPIDLWLSDATGIGKTKKKPGTTFR